MSYLQQIVQRNNPAPNAASLLRPQPVHPFAVGQGTADGISEEIGMNTPASPVDPVTIMQPVQHTTVFTGMPTGTTNREKPVPSEDKKQAVYIRSQLERAEVLQPIVTHQQAVVVPVDTHKHTNQETKEVIPGSNNTGNAQPLEPVLPPALSPVTNNQAAITAQMAQQKIVQAIDVQQIPVVKQLMPTALQEPLPQKIITPNKLVIGKITVEIVQPVQPPVKTRERIITRIVNTAAGNSSSAGRSKLSFGLGQL